MTEIAQMSIFFTKKSALKFQSKVFSHVGVKSGMGSYQLVSKTYPEIVLKKLLEQN